MSELQQDDEFQENLIKLYQVLGSAKAVADNLDISILDVYCVLKKYKLSIEERMQMSASKVFKTVYRQQYHLCHLMAILI
jgi:hypothetical protein